MTDELRSDMLLSEFQEWAERGASLKDAAIGLTFKAIHFAEASGGRDNAIPVYLEVAKIALLADIAYELHALNLSRDGRGF